MSEKIRVLVVDDSAFNRQTIKKMLESDPAIEVVGTATDGVNAIAKTLRLSPDLITLDVEMPEMDGFSFLRWLMLEKATPVIMVSSYSDSKTVFKALEMGAVDFVAKPVKGASGELKSIEKDLVAKAIGIRELNMNVLSRNLRLVETYKERPIEPVPSQRGIELVAIGTSTGGPPALQIIISKLPMEFPAGIVISQHMPKGFTKPFAERLDRLSSLKVKEAEDGDAVEKGLVLICPGGCHMQFKKAAGKLKVVLKEAGFEDKYVPSVDAMMLSAAKYLDEKMIGVILTGMGSDGREGMKDLAKRGCFTIAESEETAVVFGMPAEAINAGAAKKVLTIHNISNEIIGIVMGDRRF